jgi:hypothetical protein
MSSTLRLVVDHGNIHRRSTVSARDLRAITHIVESELANGNLPAAKALVADQHFTAIACGYIATQMVKDGIPADQIIRIFQ